MKRIRTRIIAAVLIVLTAALCLTGCGGSESDIKSMLGRFEKACQEVDVEGMMDCIDPDIIAPVRTVLGMLGVDELNKYAGQVMGVLGLVDIQGESPEDIIKTIKITPKEFSFNEDKTGCDVETEVSYQFNGATSAAAITVKCVLDDGAWYIRSVS